MRILLLSAAILLAACGSVPAPGDDDSDAGDVADAAGASDAPDTRVDGGVVEPCTPPCGANEFCEAVPGLCGGPGMCTLLPGGCPDIYQPVCGCNGMTYGNDCDRLSAGVSLAHDGPCETDCSEPPLSTGCCFDDADCQINQHCYIEMCGLVEGVCERIPDPDTCWEDADCSPGKVCYGAQICPCGATCFGPDMPGMCG